MRACAPPLSPQRRGFTLIELMAVVAIFALFLAFVAPNMSTLQGRYLGQQAERLQGALEYARESAVVSSRPHHLVIDLDLGTYHVESEELPPEEQGTQTAGTDPQAADAAGGTGEPAAAPEELDPQAAAEKSLEGRKVSLSPPKQEEAERTPVRGPLGAPTPLLDEVFFDGVQTEEGWVEAGRVDIAFEPDGVALPSVIVLSDDSGTRRGLEVLPLADAVRILDEEELEAR